MKIWNLRVEHRESPMGISCRAPLFSFLAEGGDEFLAELTECGAELPAFSKTVSVGDGIGFRFGGELTPGTRYRFRVSAGACFEETEFETAPVFRYPFRTPKDREIAAPVMFRHFFVPPDVRDARLVITGLGVYRAFLNGVRVGEDALMPGCNDYHAEVRYATYDLTEQLRLDDENELAVCLGDGWYRGRYGIDKPEERGGRVWGSEYLLAAGVTARTPAGESILLTSTDEEWSVRASGCLENSIYDGEVWDYRLADGKVLCGTELTSYGAEPIPTDAAPVREVAYLYPKKILSPAGEQILDFGQNFAGFVRFSAGLRRGQTVTLTHGEILQDGCFYRDNLRTAKARDVYTGDGKERVFEPIFSYSGFRYVRVEGLDEVDPERFCGVVLSSDLTRVSRSETGNEMINRLIENVRWGTLSNFIDIPTDCPQRDERLGWTADAQVFARTACRYLDCYPFYKKYLRDLRTEQTRYYRGDIPMYAPSLCGEAAPGGAVWADAATILPWVVWENYGDLGLLRENYAMMRDYADLLIRRAPEGFDRERFTFGDWLAQDGVCEQALNGGTDKLFLSEVYRCHSLSLTAEAARLLSEEEDAVRYSAFASRLKNAILDEFFSPAGRLTADTETAYFVALTYGFWRDRGVLIAGLRECLRKHFYRLTSGFVGTPLALPALFSAGMEEDAFRVLFNESMPGWLYEINMGATTVWERWNSVLPDGRISGTRMNSLNHYAYGAVCESIFGEIFGLRPASPGWRSARIAPHPDARLRHVRHRFLSPAGIYECAWRIAEDGSFSMDVRIPYACTARIFLPDGSEREAGAGEHSFTVTPEKDLLHPFGENSLILDLLENADARDAFRRCLPFAYEYVTGENREFLPEPLRFLSTLPMFRVTESDLLKLTGILRKIRV